jgi:hypothetical protein
VQDDPAALLERLMAEGKACAFETGADGLYLLHAYVDEPVPPDLVEHARAPIRVDNFDASGGRVFFTGVEYAFRQDDSFLRKHAHMGTSFEVPPGRYRLAVYRTECPDALADARLWQEVGRFRYLLHESMGWLILFAILALIGMVVGYFNLPRGPGFAALLLALALLVALPFAVYRSPPFRETQRRHHQLRRDYPSVIAHLERRD